MSRNPLYALPVKYSRFQLGVMVTGFFLGTFVLLSIWRDPVRSLLSPLSIFSKISGSSLSEDDGYTNFLLVGLDRRSYDISPGGLNDTMILASLSRDRKRVVLTTIPRDLWVPMSGGYKGKISSAFGYGGVDEVLEIVSKVLGVPVHYYAFVDFEGFKKGVNILEGLDIYVERTFDDYRYPIEGKEEAPEESERYEHIHFDQGWQHMEGELALKYARTRNALGPEGSDFARSDRQKKVLIAAKEKALSLSTVFNPGKLKDLLEVFGASVDTNVTISEMQQFYDLSKAIPTENIESVTIDHTSDAGKQLLYTPEDLTPYDNAWVLVPTAGDFSEVQTYLNKLLYTKSGE